MVFQLVLYLFIMCKPEGLEASKNKRNCSGQTHYLLSIQTHNYTAHSFKKLQVTLQTLNIQNPETGNVNNSLNACRNIFVTKLTAAKLAKEFLTFYEAKVSLT